MTRIVDLTSHSGAYVTVRQLADYFEVSSEAVRKWIACGILQAGQARRKSKRLISITDARAFERRQFGRAGHGGPQSATSRYSR